MKFNRNINNKFRTTHLKTIDLSLQNITHFTINMVNFTKPSRHILNLKKINFAIHCSKISAQFS